MLFSSAITAKVTKRLRSTCRSACSRILLMSILHNPPCTQRNHLSTGCAWGCGAKSQSHCRENRNYRPRCEVVGGTVKSDRKFHARGTKTEIQQTILGTDIACGGERTPLLHVIEVLAGHRSCRVIAYRKPRLSAVRLVHVVRGARTAHLGRHPTWLQSIGKRTRP